MRVSRLVAYTMRLSELSAITSRSGQVAALNEMIGAGGLRHCDLVQSEPAFFRVCALPETDIAPMRLSLAGIVSIRLG